MATWGTVDTNGRADFSYDSEKEAIEGAKRIMSEHPSDYEDGGTVEIVKVIGRCARVSAPVKYTREK